MRPAYFAALALLVGCRARPDVKAPQSAASADLAQFTRDSTDSVLHTPRVVTGPTVIVFWLPAGGGPAKPRDAVGAVEERAPANRALPSPLTPFVLHPRPTLANSGHLVLA